MPAALPAAGPRNTCGACINKLSTLCARCVLLQLHAPSCAAPPGGVPAVHIEARVDIVQRVDHQVQALPERVVKDRLGLRRHAVLWCAIPNGRCGGADSKGVCAPPGLQAALGAGWQGSRIATRRGAGRGPKRRGGRYPWPPVRGGQVDRPAPQCPNAAPHLQRIDVNRRVELLRGLCRNGALGAAGARVGGSNGTSAEHVRSSTGCPTWWAGKAAGVNGAELAAARAIAGAAPAHPPMCQLRKRNWRLRLDFSITSSSVTVTTPPSPACGQGSSWGGAGDGPRVDVLGVGATPLSRVPPTPAAMSSAARPLAVTCRYPHHGKVLEELAAQRARANQEHFEPRDALLQAAAKHRHLAVVPGGGRVQGARRRTGVSAHADMRVCAW